MESKGIGAWRHSVSSASWIWVRDVGLLDLKVDSSHFTLFV